MRVVGQLLRTGGRDVRRFATWLDRRGSLHAAVVAARRVLPGDERFGDSLSTAGSQPLQSAARRAHAWSDGRMSVGAEFGLAMLQVAEWLNADVGRRNDSPLAIVFTDLVEFSSWALRAGDPQSLELLRAVDAVVTAEVEARGGQVIKRLGDGIMATFDDPKDAVDAATIAIKQVRCVSIDTDGYRPRLRAGVHVGWPQPIGGDYIGVDVNVAARLCEVANADELLISEPVRDRVNGKFWPDERSHELRGAPAGLRVYSPRGYPRHQDRDGPAALSQTQTRRRLRQWPEERLSGLTR